jgi:GlcNAc-P-P-Und epimerase
MIQVIGGSGFVGTRLIKNLGVKNCRNLDKNESPFFNSISTIGNILNPSEINISKDVKAVVLLAAEHRDDVSPHTLYYDVNVTGTKNVLDKMDELGIKELVFTSSVAVYGLNKTFPNENSMVDPFNHYGKSKWHAEELIKKWFDKNPKNKKVTILRPTVIFGERNRGNVYNLLKQISSGNFFIIGKGKNKKSMAYVENIVNFINLKLEISKTGHEIYNYTDQPDLTMLELTSLIQTHMKIKIPRLKIPYWLGMLIGYVFDFFSWLTSKKSIISSVRVKKFCATTQFDSKKAHSIFKSSISIKSALKKTLDYEFNNKNKDEVIFYSE